MYAEPSSVGVAVVWTLPASEPASGSVRAKAASFEPSNRPGSHCACCSFGAEQEQRADADRVVGVDEHGDAGVVPAEDLHHLEVLLLAEAQAAVLGRDGDACSTPEVAEALR